MITQIRTRASAGMKRGVVEQARDPLTEKIIGCCFEVHRALGPGFPERVYQRALINSLAASQMSAEGERRFKVIFQGEPVGTFQVDLVVAGRVIVEVKAVTGLLPQVFGHQVLAYLKAAELPVGLLVNFGNSSCQVKRFAGSTKRLDNQSV